jgi:methylamine dehydrogenase heavy chain
MLAALLGSSSALLAQVPRAAALAPSTASQDVPEAEDVDVATLPAVSPRWGFITDGWAVGGTRVVDGESGKIVGMVHNGPLANFAMDPQGRFFYMAETIWTRGNRGKRQDLLTVYDAHTLKILAEIDLPGRLLIGNRIFNLTVSQDGRTAYVYNLDPASSVIVVDLIKRRFVRSIEVPGCGLAIPAPSATTVSLCSDGSMATIRYDAKLSGAPERTAAFFSAQDDPIFDNSVVDTRSGKALFLTYSGLIYEVGLGLKPVIGAPWSLQEAGGAPKASTAPLATSWLPGGREPIAYNRTTGRAYVLMHLGEFWSQNLPATELWEVDVAARKVLRRKPLDNGMGNIAVTQDAAPLLFLNSEDGKLVILDAATLEQKHELKDVGSGNIVTAGM